MTVDIAISLVGTRPPAAVCDRRVRLPRPAGVIKAGWNSMRGRCNGQQVSNHGFVESSKPVIDEPRPLRRPMPQQRVILRGAPVPIPLNAFPEFGNPVIDTFSRI